MKANENPRRLTHYQRLIIEFTDCTEEESTEVEDIMRHDVVHSKLDWLSREQFKVAAKQAHEIFVQENAASA